ncbi:glycoside hydrolase family 15 protein [Candidatus Nitronereus thalassa]|uniref:Glycoside hydrolase family 15 protein n=1 Tax=Candidatus Nitronereus thalassa TaxID=3020898 RepID=A0ABU3KCK8_9BACT|nr:glycoside hydrolase family 15 protein [Candidatus Nitronereus thalassa]MDT7044133.1 glycoside hydrolase family 15 protein [Candidatus Nitronereus thalassa]
MTYKPIGDYGIIGDLHTIALVSTNGSIDWCCLPHFDSPSVFAAMLDHKQGGHFKISPIHEGNQRQMYLPETNILLTRFFQEDGVGEITDFMPVESDAPGYIPKRHQIIRMVAVTRGQVQFRLECAPSFNYGRDSHTVMTRDTNVIFRSQHAVLGLVSPIPIEAREGMAFAEFTLSEGQSLTFFIEYLEANGSDTLLATPESGDMAFQNTSAFWQRWLSQCQYSGRWRETVHRSALTLKLLTYAPTGAIVAAPTTSLPEAIGGPRNWDYRYTWMRDAAFTVYGLLRLGFTTEAGRFMDWLNARCHDLNPDGSLQLVYGIDGRRNLPEEELTHLDGYQSSKPVRIGNAASHQLQLDMYGTLMDAVYLYDKHGTSISFDLWMNLCRLLDYVCNNWELPDEGIWEVRGGRRHFVYSKVMCWVALDRGIRLADQRGFPGNRTQWMHERDRIYIDVMERGYNTEIEAFVQHYDTTALDAANLIMSLVHFVSPTDPRMISTLNRTLEQLTMGSLVYRYRVGEAAPDGLEGDEGTFSMCTFWLVEALTRAGRLQEARLIFEKMLSYANHLRLYAEEVSHTGEQLGNFPQAFTHFGLISAATNLDLALNTRQGTTTMTRRTPSPSSKPQKP